MRSKANRLCLSLCLAAALVACGGGGGGGDSPDVDEANQADGLGDAGHAPGTVEIGNAAEWDPEFTAQPAVAIALAEDGRALAVWQLLAKDGDKVAWAQSDADGGWGTASELPQAREAAYSDGLVLRMNRDTGDAVLGWSNQQRDELAIPWGMRVARFVQGAGWDGVTYKAEVDDELTVQRDARSWDLAMLDDGSFTLTLPVHAEAGDRSAVLRTALDGTRTFSLTSELPTSVHSHPYAAYAVKANGYGLLFQSGDSVDHPGQVDVVARLAQVDSEGFGAFPVGTFTNMCGEIGDSPLVAAVTPQAEGVLAVLAADTETGSCEYNELWLHRVYTDGPISVRREHVNAPGTFLPVAPVVVVDSEGNALALWKEKAGNRYQAPAPGDVKIMWSSSLYGEPWSKPEALDVGPHVLEWGTIALAMNAGGQAVVAVRLQEYYEAHVDESIAIAQFNFNEGWTKPKKVANKLDLSDPQVAINADGTALLAYTANAAPRVGGRSPSGYEGAARIRAFAYRF